MRQALAIIFISTLLLASPQQNAPVVSMAPAIPGEPLSLEEFWQQMEETRDAVADLQGEDEITVLQGLEEILVQWLPVEQVKMPDGSLVNLDLDEFRQLLKSDHPDLEYLLDRLDALLAAWEEFPQGVFTQADIETLQSILSRPEFQPQESFSLQEWVDKLWNKVLDWLKKLFGRSVEEKSLSIGTIPFPTWIPAVLLFMAILAYALRGIFTGWVREATLPEELFPGDEILTSETAFNQAGTLSNDGNYRVAIRYLYLSALLLLDEQGLLRYDHSRTNREYLRSISNSPTLFAPFRFVVETFDRVWYGFEPVDQASYQEYLEQVALLRNQKP